MLQVKFYDEYKNMDDSLLRFSVIVSRYQHQWVFCKHKERTTYEVPGGHRELGEDVRAAAVRELYEETGASRFDISPVCVYSVVNERYPEEESFGMLYFADIYSFQELPDGSEMESVVLFPELPGKLTYPDIQPELYRKVKSMLESH